MKFAWINPNGTWKDRKEAIIDALESGFDHIIDFDNAETIKELGNISIISNKDDADITLVGYDEKPQFKTLEKPKVKVKK